MHVAHTAKALQAAAHLQVLLPDTLFNDGLLGLRIPSPSTLFLHSIAQPVPALEFLVAGFELRDGDWP